MYVNFVAFFFFRLVFSQSLLSLDLIERFLEKVDKKYQEDINKKDEEKRDNEEKKDKKEGVSEEVRFGPIVFHYIIVFWA